MKKDSKKYEDSFRELQNNMKHNNIWIIGIPEGEVQEKGIETLFEKIMTENFPNLERGKDMQIQEADGPNQNEPKEVYSKTYQNRNGKY